MKLSSILLAIALVATAGASHAQTQKQLQEAARVPGSLILGVAAHDDSAGLQARPEPEGRARLAAQLKTYIVTATYDGKPFRVMNVVVDSEGLAYSTSQQSFHDASGDELYVHVTSIEPVVFTVAVVKGDASAQASRDRVAVEPLAEGASADALRDGHLAVHVERLADTVELRATSILANPHVLVNHNG